MQLFSSLLCWCLFDIVEHLDYMYLDLKQGHAGPVVGMACHPSGGLLATAGADHKVQVWDVDGGFCTHYFKGHKGVVTSIAFHPHPDRLLVSFPSSAKSDYYHLG